MAKEISTETLATTIVSIVLPFQIMTDIDNKERIKLRANDLFMKFGIRSVSMDDIANNLGMSKKTIYQYYADKDELVDAVIEHEIQHNEALLNINGGKIGALSKKFYDEVTAIQYGEKPDKFCWMLKI